MIKELVQFTKKALEDPVFQSYGVMPKDGLHIVLSVERKDGQTTISDTPVFAGIFNSKKKTEVKDWWVRCTEWWKASTMLGTVDTQKVFDIPSRAIHTVSPFCIGLKRKNLPGGEQYLDNEARDKSQVFDRVDNYFSKAVALLDTDEDKFIAEAFRISFRNINQVAQWLESTGCYKEVKDGDYVVFYIDLPKERYEVANRKYLKEKLFNTDKYNVPDPDSADPENPEIYGTSNWLNRFPTEKPFLMHQTAVFDIAGRITSSDAGLLYEFSDMSRRKLLPNPLPVFIMPEEQKKAFKIFKDDINSGESKRKGYLEIIGEMRDVSSVEIGNYYLLFMQAGEIRDFDFVSKFEHNLNSDGSSWEIKDLFGTKHVFNLYTVNDLMREVLPPLFSNTLIVARKDKDWSYRWFDDIDPVYCKTDNAYLLTMKYRKAFYDFIYKSQRQSVTGSAIKEILLAGILDDIRLDKYENGYNKENFNIRTKLNLLFGLHSYFSKDSNSIFMASKIEHYRDQVEAIAEGNATLESDNEFAFAAGQVIDRLFSVSMTGDKSFGYLEPFLAQSSEKGFKNCLLQFFKRYKHGNFSKRFENVFSDVMAYEMQGSFKEIMPLILAGVFSSNLLYATKKEEPVAIDPPA